MGGDSIEFDTVRDLCRARHCRIVLAVLAGERRSLTLRDLTTKVLEYSDQPPMSELSAEGSNQIRASLRDVHIPRLESIGVVELDPEREVVEPTGQFDQLEPHLSAILDGDPDFEPPINL